MVLEAWGTGLRSCRHWLGSSRVSLYHCWRTSLHSFHPNVSPGGQRATRSRTGGNGCLQQEGKIGGNGQSFSVCRSVLWNPAHWFEPDFFAGLEVGGVAPLWPLRRLGQGSKAKWTSAMQGEGCREEGSQDETEWRSQNNRLFSLPKHSSLQTSWLHNCWKTPHWILWDPFTKFPPNTESFLQQRPPSPHNSPLAKLFSTGGNLPFLTT